MYTLYGKEARNGDFVLIQDVRYMQGSADIRVAQVHNGKAYAAAAVPSKGTQHRWLRKETAIIVIPANIVSEQAKELIQMNIDADKSTFDIGTDYFTKVWELQNEVYRIEQQMRETIYEDYRQ